MDALIQCCWKKPGCIHFFKNQQCGQSTQRLVSSYKKKDSVKLWGGKCNSLVLFLKLLLHLNNGRTKGKDGNTQEEYQIHILYILQMKKPGTLRNYTLQQNDLTKKTCNIEARELKTAVKNIIHG